MTRARTINIGHAASRSTLAAAVAVAMASRAVTAPDPMVIENRGQAMPKGARRAALGDTATSRKASRKAAAQELVRISNQTLVVSHLHPRWLRSAVARMMAAGAKIDMAAVDLLRGAGPEGATMIADAYVG